MPVCPTSLAAEEVEVFRNKHILMEKKIDQQKGVSLIVTFFVMTILLAAVIALVTMLIKQSAITTNSSSSVSAFYAADTGIEKTLYFDRKQIPSGATRGFCNICAVCTDCVGCTLTALAPGGCATNTCNNCELTYNSTFDNRTYYVDATLVGTHLLINAKGLFGNTLRVSQFDSAKP